MIINRSIFQAMLSHYLRRALKLQIFLASNHSYNDLNQDQLYINSVSVPVGRISTLLFHYSLCIVFCCWPHLCFGVVEYSNYQTNII